MILVAGGIFWAATYETREVEFRLPVLADESVFGERKAPPNPRWEVVVFPHLREGITIVAVGVVMIILGLILARFSTPPENLGPAKLL